MYLFISAGKLATVLGCVFVDTIFLSVAVDHDRPSRRGKKAEGEEWKKLRSVMLVGSGREKGNSCRKMNILCCQQYQED